MIYAIFLTVQVALLPVRYHDLESIYSRRDQCFTHQSGSPYRCQALFSYRSGPDGNARYQLSTWLDEEGTYLVAQGDLLKSNNLYCIRQADLINADIYRSGRLLSDEQALAYEPIFVNARGYKCFQTRTTGMGFISVVVELETGNGLNSQMQQGVWVKRGSSITELR